VREMVKLAKSRGIGVLLIGTPEPGFSVTPLKFYASIAEEYGIPYEEGIIGQVLTDSTLKADPIHPNARGYRIIAERLAETLKQSGAL
jgi:acyl-CoA thioesterase-1